jgi:hypothetical protein
LSDDLAAPIGGAKSDDLECNQSFYDEKSRMNHRETTMSKSSLQGNNYGDAQKLFHIWGEIV